MHTWYWYDHVLYITTCPLLIIVQYHLAILCQPFWGMGWGTIGGGSIDTKVHLRKNTAGKKKGKNKGKGEEKREKKHFCFRYVQYMFCDWKLHRQIKNTWTEPGFVSTILYYSFFNNSKMRLNWGGGIAEVEGGGGDKWVVWWDDKKEKEW